MNTVYIHTNNKQFFGAILSKYSFEKTCVKNRNFDVKIINVDEKDEFKKIFSKPIKMNGKEIIYSENDLQSFTLARFMPPTLSENRGKSFIIDPDIFCISEIFTTIFDVELDNPIGAVKQKGKFLSSAMLLDNCKLSHWKIEEIIQDLIIFKHDYRYFMDLEFEDGNVSQIDDAYNHLDTLNDETVLLHNTNRLTQPWKTGLKIDFRREKMKPILGIIPRELVHFILGKRRYTYQQHPDPNQINFFMKLVCDALNDDAVTRNFIEQQIRAEHVRADLLKMIDEYNAT